MSPFGHPRYTFDEVSSTMDVAHQLAREGASEGTLIVAKRQTAGRGRAGRPWISPEGGAYFSLILKPARPAAEIPQLSLVAGLAAADAVQELTRLSPSIRWPNDLLLDGKKIAGILVEAKHQAISNQQSAVSKNNCQSAIDNPQSAIPLGWVVIGIGINITTLPEDIADIATSLAACGASCDSHQLVAAVCRQLDHWYDTWTAHGFAPVREALRSRLSHVGQLVRMTAGTAQIEGQVADVDEAGRLLVRLDSGIVRAFEAGEVTLLR